MTFNCTPITSGIGSLFLLFAVFLALHLYIAL